MTEKGKKHKGFNDSLGDEKTATLLFCIFHPCTALLVSMTPLGMRKQQRARILENSINIPSVSMTPERMRKQ